MDLDRLERLAKAATPGPWGWFGHLRGPMYLATRDRGRIMVMGFRRLGMSSAQPEFRDHSVMKSARELAVREVPYRDDIVAIDHPDAEYLAALDPSTVLALIAEVRTLRQAVSDTGTALLEQMGEV